MGQTSSEKVTKNDSLIVDTVYDTALNAWMLRTNDVGAKAIRFVYEQRNALRDEAVSLQNELDFCDSELLINERIINEQQEILTAKDARIENAQRIISLREDDMKSLKKRILIGNIREVFLGVIGVASISYGIYITVK